MSEQIVKSVTKRNGHLVTFKVDKIRHAIQKAFEETGEEVELDEVVQIVTKKLDALVEPIPIETIQNVIERILHDSGYYRTARAYILYREQRTLIRKEKCRILGKTELDEVDKQFDINAINVLKSRYLVKENEDGESKGSIKQRFQNISINACIPEVFWTSPAEGTRTDKQLRIGRYKLNKWHLKTLQRLAARNNRNDNALQQDIEAGCYDHLEEVIFEIYKLMVTKKYMPNTPTLANYGKNLGLGSACFVLDVEDSMSGIMETLGTAAEIFKYGGGCGYNFSKLRCEGSPLNNTNGHSSGPVSFMTLFDKMTDVVKQGGIRRGANMGILNIDHADVVKFITAKEGNKQLTNFNVSVLIFPEFMKAVEKNLDWDLIDPATKTITQTIKARELWELMIKNAWSDAEPGMIFFDKVNEVNPLLEALGPIVTTNPCITGDALVVTDEGLIRLDQAAHNISVMTESGRMMQKVKWYNQGPKETITIKTRSGYEVTCTPEHKIMTTSGWMEARKLLGQLVKLQPIEADLEQYIPDGLWFELNEKFFEWLGMIIGDGDISQEVGVNLSCGNDSELYDYFKGVLPNEPSKYYWDKSVRELHWSTRSLRQILKEKLGVGYWTSSTKRVPDIVFRSSLVNIRAFLRGYFTADGSAFHSAGQNVVDCWTISDQLAKDIQQLLITCGIKSRRYAFVNNPIKDAYDDPNGKSYIGHSTHSEVHITSGHLKKFLDTIGFILPRKIAKLKIDVRYHAASSRLDDEVVDIVSAGIQNVYDISVNEEHSFIANGIVVSNCGEVLLYPNEPCNLGSLNLTMYMNDQGSFDWTELEQDIELSVRFLDNVIEANYYPLQKIEDMSLLTRKIGLGVMGFAEILVEMDIPYDSEEGIEFAEELMSFIAYHGRKASNRLAKVRGSFPLFSKSSFAKGELPFKGDGKLSTQEWLELKEEVKLGTRNVFVTVIAPTGSISMIAGCQSGIEPIYALTFEKRVAIGNFEYVVDSFKNKMMKLGLWGTDMLMDTLAKNGSVQDLRYIPDEVKRVFKVANEISGTYHIKMQAAFQRWTDSSISKTINLPEDVTQEEVGKIFKLAYELDCKDVTVYRNKSIANQVMNSGCPNCGAPIKKEESCKKCTKCEWQTCTL